MAGTGSAHPLPVPPQGGLPAGLVAGLFLAAALLPLALALASGEEPGGWAEEAGAGLGLAALALLLLQFAHSGRVEALSGRIGIDRTLRVHRSAGLALLAMAVLHPVAYVLPLLLDDPAAGLARLHAMAGSERMRTGMLAWLALLAVVLMALWRRRMRYETWRLTHGIGAALAVGFGTAHALQVGLYTEVAPGLRWLWIGGAAAAFAALGWTWVAKPLLAARAGWRVAEVRRIGEGYWELVLEGGPPGGICFAAGQFCWLAFGRAAPWDDNPFSIASAPGDPRLRFVIVENGDRTGAIGALPPGLPVRLDGPHGAFTLQGRDEGSPLLLVAGGAGIAPILSLLRDLAARGAARPVRVLHGARRPQRLVARKEVAAIVAAHPGWRAVWRAEEEAEAAGLPPGLLDRAALEAALEGLDPCGVLALICGPEPMTLAVAARLEEMGVPPGRIVFELFDYA